MWNSCNGINSLVAVLSCSYLAVPWSLLWLFRWIIWTCDLVTHTDNIQIMSDFNIHMDLPSEPFIVVFQTLINSLGFTEIIDEVMHKNDNTFWFGMNPRLCNLTFNDLFIYDCYRWPLLYKILYQILQDRSYSTVIRFHVTKLHIFDQQKVIFANKCVILSLTEPLCVQKHSQ